MCVLGFCGINLFHQLSPFPFQTTKLPLHSHFVPNVHFVVGHFMPPNFPHDEDLFAQIVEVPQMSIQNIHHHAQRTNASFDAIQTNARW
jgi:hypothetical protein